MRKYHHGGLRSALIEVSIELIGRDGVAAFSVAEACRLLEVSPAAPYRHFSDRRELLEAIAVRGLGVLAEHVTVSRHLHPDPVDRLSLSAYEYVVFAAMHPALFEVILCNEVLINTNARMMHAVRPVVEAFVLPTYELAGIADRDASEIVIAAAAIAHSYGAYLKAGNFGQGEKTVAATALKASRAVRALVGGRETIVDGSDEAPIVLAGMSFHCWVEAVSARETADGRK